MNNNSKKVSFSFSKKKKPPLAKQVGESKEVIEYVDYIDYAEEKPKKSNKAEIKQLIIPLVDSRGCREVLENRLEKKKESKNLLNEVILSSSNDTKLTELAAAEILNDAQNINDNLLDSQEIVTEQEKISLSKEQKNDINEIDYELVPVTDFGLAMLRGMGWKPNSGIGKNPKIIATTSPKLRPKGLGLGVSSSKSHSKLNS